MSTYTAIKLTPMLESHDIPATLKFYTTILGFTCEAKFDDLSWFSLSKDGIEIMFCMPNEHRNMPKAVMSGSLYIKTNEVKQLWEILKDQCEICYPLEDFDYGMREFAIYDNNGYLLQFGQEL
ncbi:VOC family protein [Pedobacter zeae]|uniref:Bleomycin resistance family protein n=1 Tax=Pedobacter zeae TaxID=1737356 RepID=A0A7W6P4M5_9SPHI|nr:VOC family protein [Pedobacter zeae]MBB4106044.1 putative glyoxalase superfamily protein PhnB [Pedobacter zeae]GGH19326.1 bleomycin resistance family protein [Pedobacter zeae]